MRIKGKLCRHSELRIDVGSTLVDKKIGLPYPHFVVLTITMNPLRHSERSEESWRMIVVER